MAGSAFSKTLNDLYFLFSGYDPNDPNAPDPGKGLFRPWTRFEIHFRKVP